MHLKWRTCLQILFLSLVMALGGCATTSSLTQSVHKRKPVIMSGTRLNIATLSNRSFASERFGVVPPRYPLLDMPGSAALDLIMLGYTVPVALYYAIN